MSGRPSRKPRSKRPRGGGASSRRRAASPALPREGVRRKVVLWLVAAGATLVIAVSALLSWSLSPASEKTSEAPVFVVLASADAGAATDALARAGLVRSPRLFHFYLRMIPGLVLEPGEHLLRLGLSPRELAARLGRLPGRARVTLVVPEGFSRRKIAARLEKSEVCRARGFLEASEEAALLAELGLVGPSSEGYLFPATYELSVDTRPDELVRRMVREAQKRLAALRSKHPEAFAALAEKGYSERDVVTLASIVERETGLADERRLIASVFHNRLSDPTLEPKGRLQSDPTAAYGCEYEPERAASCDEYGGRVTPAMLRDADNRYNTYRHAGLPPGPIASPGIAALSAVVDPAKSDYLYFVADGGGKHTFSRSFEDHQAAVERLRARRGPSAPVSPVSPVSTPK